MSVLVLAFLALESSGARYPSALAAAITLELAAALMRRDRPQSAILALFPSSRRMLLLVRLPCTMLASVCRWCSPRATPIAMFILVGQSTGLLSESDLTMEERGKVAFGHVVEHQELLALGSQALRARRLGCRSFPSAFTSVSNSFWLLAIFSRSRFTAT
ncbi:LOW QUALITY PROTEIN: hypothetical protein U9M48_007130 [Paspalum notatum var. saurae]|uniref:Secreted protein n=1 Tax=Paspalum notatum var. saurae TaxID=547442 RepID=A0AAQ3PW17_PASNO